MGVEANLAAGEILPTVNWIVLTETDRSPMVSLGTSSDRIFTKEGERAYYVTFAKSHSKLKIAPYASINYSEADRTVNFPFGVNIVLSPTIDLLPMNDGRKTHLLINFKQIRSNVILMAVDLARPRFGVSFGWTVD